MSSPAASAIADIAPCTAERLARPASEKASNAPPFSAIEPPREYMASSTSTIPLAAPDSSFILSASVVTSSPAPAAPSPRPSRSTPRLLAIILDASRVSPAARKEESILRASSMRSCSTALEAVSLSTSLSCASRPTPWVPVPRPASNANWSRLRIASSNCAVIVSRVFWVYASAPPLPGFIAASNRPLTSKPSIEPPSSLMRLMYSTIRSRLSPWAYWL